MKKSMLTMKSMTTAIHATKILEANKIATAVVRLPPELSVNGCAYGIEVAPAYADRAVHILRVSDISYGRLIK